MKSNWKHVGQVMAGKKRFRILVRLNEGPCTPKQLSEELDIKMPNVSTTLRELLGYNCVENLTPKNKKGKLYGITNHGKQVLKQIHEVTKAKKGRK